MHYCYIIFHLTNFNNFKEFVYIHNIIQIIIWHFNLCNLLYNVILYYIVLYFIANNSKKKKRLIILTVNYLDLINTLIYINWHINKNLLICGYRYWLLHSNF